jgi:hypothetical protein
MGMFANLELGWIDCESGSISKEENNYMKFNISTVSVMFIFYRF